MAFDVSVIYEAVDKFTAPARRISDALKKNQAGFERASRAAAKFQKSLKKAGDSMTKVGKNLRNRVTLPLVGAAALLFKSALEDQQAARRFKVVFAGIEDDAKKAADVLRKSFGRSGTDAEQMLGSMTDLLTGFGFNTKEALDLALAVNKLAIDLSVFTGISGGAKSAAKNLANGLAGAKIGLKELGVILTESDINEELERQGINVKNLSNSQAVQAKTIATIALIQRKAKSSTNAFAESQDFLAVKVQLARSQLDDLISLLAEGATPAFGMVLDKTQEWLRAFNKMTPETRKFILQMSVLAAAIPLVILSLGLLLRVVAFFMKPIRLLGVLIGVVASAFTLASRDMDAFREKFPSLARIMDSLKELGDALKPLFTELVELARILEPILGPLLQASLELTLFIIREITAAIKFIIFLANKVTGLFGGGKIEVGAKQGLSTPSVNSGLNAPPPGVLQAAAALDVNIIDKGGNVGGVRSTNNGFSSLNVGRNLAPVFGSARGF